MKYKINFRKKSLKKVTNFKFILIQLKHDIKCKVYLYIFIYII